MSTTASKLSSGWVMLPTEEEDDGWVVIDSEKDDDEWVMVPEVKIPKIPEVEGGWAFLPL